MLDKMKNLLGFNSVEPEAIAYYKCTTKVCRTVFNTDTGTKVYIKEEQYCTQSATGYTSCRYESCSCY